jgi:hypothetical protein
MMRSGLTGCGRIGRVHADSTDVHLRAEFAHVDSRIVKVAA